MLEEIGEKDDDNDNDYVKCNGMLWLHAGGYKVEKADDNDDDYVECSRMLWLHAGGDRGEGWW